MAKKYILQHRPENTLPGELTDSFCDMWLFKLHAYTCIDYAPISMCCGLDAILATKPFPYGALRLWMIHHINKVQRIWQYDIVLRE